MKCFDMPVYGLHGESHAAPMSTIPAFWGALGAGADGIALGVQMTGDGVIICSPGDTLIDKNGGEVRVRDMTADEIREFDAGARFRSIELDSDNRPTGRTGEDTPWVGSGYRKPHLYFPRLEEVLRLFGRRTKLMLLLAEDGDGSSPRWTEIANAALEVLSKFGLLRRVIIVASLAVCRLIRERSPFTETALIADDSVSVKKNVEAAVEVNANYLYILIEKLKMKLNSTVDYRGIRLLIWSREQPYAPTPRAYHAALGTNNIHALVMRSVHRTVQLVRPPSLVLSDDFPGKEINKDIWSAGYSHCNTDTSISQDKGLVISIMEGGSYSGGAGLTVMPVHGPFDACVDVFVGNPGQGTTLEMACIGIDPGYFHIDNTDLNTRNVNLTFDVHGAPPYASSERDEADGYRIGWNNGYNLTRVDDDWAASSVNMYNKYGRDVGNGSKDNPVCSLRLQRCGSVFNAYYKDKYNHAWVLSGSALVGNLGPDVHIRLGAKHWAKGGMEPPANHVVFSRFRLYQF